MIFYDILCYSILCYSMLFYSMLFYSMLFYSSLCYSMLFYAILCYSIILYAIICYSMLFYSMLFYSMLFYSMLFYSSIFCSVRSALPASVCFVVAVRRLLARPRQRAVARGHRRPQHPEHLRRLEPVGRQPEPEEAQEGGEEREARQGAGVLLQQHVVGRPRLRRSRSVRVVRRPCLSPFKVGAPNRRIVQGSHGSPKILDNALKMYKAFELRKLSIDSRYLYQSSKMNAGNF